MYTGDVTRGGPADVRVLDEVEIRKVSVGPMDNAAYLLTCRREQAQLLVDAADEPDRLLALVREGTGSARLDVVVTTHQHADHHRALASVVAVTGATTAAGAADAAAITAATGVPVRRPLHDGDVLAVGHAVLEVVALRGHTEGSVALLYREPERVQAPDAVAGRAHLFTGDSLFPGGVGATGGDAGRFARLLEDVERRVFDRLGDETWVYPGHGADTTLGAERPHLAEWRARGW
ncbi:MBL fold metallo-hydrolase [Cellulomonas fimi]|uniref:Zn-dependent hydrolase, glyoxylase n=1 Tax=Cellulomonas fimi (strain ATCC 484 / DSM 20113 / JCM 1341 / CCUG 24087 / LMG 16345 / NBRC 15513 / NCIMB 8980 / NCTC 7547 / NRS-133) TaxID=590998 RepID=F4GYZ5_CELFA|nr:MBL fold metallo-hydrolase [Cellulomonas fimi]AEE45985.1 Zn-dependent hydrolase, glyoxylase [Cellulomonas fimi ATCC 484]NNH06571.1 MBL fold metallo-hydrolase [Cellulomonas fimi]VEH31197.1 Probable polyketide biosynthesis zinc-dependent hydrolase BaeB [Cellulomonas fimi]